MSETDVTLAEITGFSRHGLSDYQLQAIHNIIRNHNRLWRLGLFTRDQILAQLITRFHTHIIIDDDDSGITSNTCKKRKKQHPPREGERQSRRIKRLDPEIDELYNQTFEERDSTDDKEIPTHGHASYLKKENEIIDHLSYFGATHLYAKAKPGDNNIKHRQRRKRMNTALNKYQRQLNYICTNIGKNDIINDIKSGGQSIYNDSNTTNAANAIISSADESPRCVVKKLATDNILLTFNKRNISPPQDQDTIIPFRICAMKNKPRPTEHVNSSFTVTFNINVISKHNTRFHDDIRTHGKLHENYNCSFNIDLNRLNTTQLIPFNIFSRTSQPFGSEETFRPGRLLKAFKESSDYLHATSEDRQKYNALDIEGYYFCIKKCTKGTGCRLPVYIEESTFIVWALVRDYVDTQYIEKAVEHASEITNNNDIGGFFGHMLLSLVRYSAKRKMIELLVKKECSDEDKFVSNTFNGIKPFLDRVINRASIFMKRLMKHSIHHLPNHITRNDLWRIGWVLWGQDNADWYDNKKMKTFFEQNQLDDNYFIFIAIMQSYDTKDENTEEIALILSAMSRNSHEFNKVYAGATFEEVMNEYSRLLQPYSTSNERAFLHMSAMFVLSVYYDGKIPMDVVDLRAFHQSGIKKSSIILNTSPDGRHIKNIPIGKDIHVRRIIRAIILHMPDIDVKDFTDAQMERCIDYVCRHMPENPAGK